MIILINFDYCLVANALDKKRLLNNQVRYEQLIYEKYNQWLIERIKSQYSILITDRPSGHKDAILQNLLNKASWKPQEIYFNIYHKSSIDARKIILENIIFSKHGRNEKLYFAIENDPHVKNVYKHYGIRCEDIDTIMADHNLFKELS